MKKERQKRNWPFIFSILLFLSLAITIIFLIVKLIYAPSFTYENGKSTRSDYLLMLLQCTLGLVVMFLPTMIKKKFQIIVPDIIYIMYLIFLYFAIYLGEVYSFYYLIPFWDSILHGFSGAMLGAIGFSIINILNKEKLLMIKLSPLFVALFAFCFAVTLGVFWEIYEFTVDGLLGLNMQKFATQDGTLLIGREALIDTMKDLITDVVGALVMSSVGYISIKKIQS